MMVKEEPPPNWLDSLLHGASTPKPPALNSDRIKEFAGRGLLSPGKLSLAEVQELSAAVINHLVEKKL